MRLRKIAEKAALTGRTPLEVMLEAMRCHQEAGNLDRAAAIAKDAAPYMHPRLHAVAGANGVSIPPEDDAPDLVMMARKIALAFRLAAQEKAEQIEDPADGGD